jgi:hypothetical protein
MLFISKFINKNTTIYGIIRKFIKEFSIPQLLFPTGFLAVYLSLIWTPADYHAWLSGDTGFFLPFLSDKVDSFNRGIGQALINGFDITARVKNMIFYGFFYLPLLFMILYGFVCLFLRKCKKDINDEVYSFINTLTWTALASLVIQLFNRLSSNIFSYFNLIPVSMVILLIIYIRFFSSKIPFEKFKWCLFTGLLMEIPAIVFFIMLGNDFNTSLPSTIFLSMLLFILVILLTVLMIIFYHRKCDDAFCNSFTPLYAAPIVLSIFLELSNIFNQHQIFITNKIRYSVLIFLISILCCAGYYLILKRYNGAFETRKWQYPLLIVSFAMLMVQPVMQKTVDKLELFETSNFGSTIAGLFQFGQIPLVDNLGAHMLYDVLGGLLYGWLNNDPIGGIYFSYSIFIPILYLLYFYLFKKIVNADFAILLIFLFPLTALYEFKYFGLGIILILTALYAYTKENELSMFLFCISCALMCLIRMDLVMFSISGIITLTLIFVIEKRKEALKRLWIIGFFTGIFILVIYILLCIKQGIQPLARLLEFQDIMASNVSWAYSKVANYSEWYYFLFYLILPSSVMFCIFIVFIKIKKEKQIDSNEKILNTKILPTDLLIILLLAFSYLANYQRAIVRHNLLEGNLDILFATAPLCICISCYLINKKNINVLSGCLSAIIFLQLICGSTNLTGNTLLQSSLSRQMDLTLYQEYNEKIDRVILTDNAYKSLKFFFDNTLAKNETFFDFTSNTLLYALTEREKPVYTNQSPSQLNTEFSQLTFIHDIENSNCPYALVMNYSKGFDSIPMRVNHYLVSEYLSQNYMPLCTVGAYQIWAKKDCYEQKKLLVENLLNQLFGELQQIILLDYYSSAFTRIHDTSIEQINGNLQFKNGKTDPYVIGFENNSLLKQEMASSNFLITEIEYTSTETGNFQCFYTLKDGESYSEKQSIVTKIDKKEGKFSFFIPCTSNTKIRFDFPNGSVFSIKNMRVDGIKKEDYNVLTTLYSIKLIDYTSETLPHNYDILYLPYYWGTYDKTKPQTELDLTNNIKAEEPLNLNLSAIDLSKGNYIEIIADSNTEGTAKLHVSNDKYGDLINTSFNIISGIQNRYLIRISWDSLWYSGLCEKLSLSSDQELKNVSISILQGDIDYGSMNFLKHLALKKLLYNGDIEIFNK